MFSSHGRFRKADVGLKRQSESHGEQTAAQEQVQVQCTAQEETDNGQSQLFEQCSWEAACLCGVAGRESGEQEDHL